MCCPRRRRSAPHPSRTTRLRPASCPSTASPIARSPSSLSTRPTTRGQSRSTLSSPTPSETTLT
eukprot:1028095-Pleurochrysis_carterae.AAC.4